MTRDFKILAKALVISHLKLNNFYQTKICILDRPPFLPIILKTINMVVKEVMKEMF